VWLGICGCGSKMIGENLLCPLCREDTVEVRIDWDKDVDKISFLCRPCNVIVDIGKCSD